MENVAYEGLIRIKDMQIDSLLTNGKMSVYVDCNPRGFYFTREDAVKLIDHLNKVFELES